MNILFTHIFFTLGSMVLGYLIFLFKKIKSSIALYTLSTFLIISAISGALLNLRYFSVFHILSIVVLTTIPFGIYKKIKDNNFVFLYRQVWFNFLGLNMAFIGALYPNRYMGQKFWTMLENVFGFGEKTSLTLFFLLFALCSLFVIYLVYKTVKEIKVSNKK